LHIDGQRLFERSPPIKFMNVIKIDPLDTQSAQRGLEVMGNLTPAERRLARRAAVGITNLGRDLRAPEKRGVLRLKPFAEDDFPIADGDVSSSSMVPERFSSAKRRMEMSGMRHRPTTLALPSRGAMTYSFTLMGPPRPIIWDCMPAWTKYAVALKKKNPKIMPNSAIRR